MGHQSDKYQEDKKGKTIKQTPQVLKHIVRVRLVKHAFTSQVIAHIKADSAKLLSKRIPSVKVYLDKFLENTNLYLRTLGLDPIDWIEMQELVHLAFYAPVFLKTGCENKNSIHFVELRQKEFIYLTSSLGNLNPSKPEINWLSFFAEQEPFEDLEFLKMFIED